MEIRYLGFDQRENSRIYRFDVHQDGTPNQQHTVSASMDAFRTNSVGIQEGPTLSGKKLTADLESGVQSEHELTSRDLRAYVDNREMEEARRAEMRKAPRRRPTPPAYERSPWRGTRP